ncbi:MAG: hypothetical protein IJJ47_08920 [Methanosphaera sp.]|nr:hypothetical protein [Methanosphaera sp.]
MALRLVKYSTTRLTSPSNFKVSYGTSPTRPLKPEFISTIISSTNNLFSISPFV